MILMIKHSLTGQFIFSIHSFAGAVLKKQKQNGMLKIIEIIFLTIKYILNCVYF